MHDLLNDLAQSVTDGECLRLTGTTSVGDIRSCVRHLYIDTSSLDVLEKVSRCTHLYTLHLSFSGRYSLEHAKVFKKVLKALKRVHILSLSVCGMEDLPAEIGDLKHIRYLELRGAFKQLPSSICKLYHLQVLKMDTTGSTPCIVPKGMSNLICLRHLLVPSCISDMITGIGKMTSLQGLRFSINARVGNKIGDLKGMRELRELKIEGLENVMNPEEANDAMLCNKEYLSTLQLSWCANDRSERNQRLIMDKQVLDGLRPHSNVRKLTVSGYTGSRFSDWMTYQSMNNLEHVNLENCSGLAHLPPLEKLPFLKYLCMENMPALKLAGCDGGFLQLEILIMRRLEQWEGWSGSGKGVSQWCPSLRVLRLEQCPKLKELPCLPLSLRELTIHDVGLLNLPPLWRGRDDNGSCNGSISSPFSYLSKLYIHACSDLKSLADTFIEQCLAALEHLEIKDCEQLAQLPVEGFRNLCSLKILEFWNCPMLLTDDALLAGLTSLYYLELDSCDSITSLPSGEVMGSLVVLKEVVIHACHELSSLEGLQALPHLDRLEIGYCPKLEVLSSLPLSLKSLRVVCVRLRKLPTLRFDCCSTSSSSSYSSLSTLYICACQNLKSLADSFLGEHLINLEHLQIIDCHELTQMPAEGFRNLCALKKLELWGCPKLEANGNLLRGLASLSELILHGCNSITTLSSSAEVLTSLEYLMIAGCTELTSLGSSLYSLPSLRMSRIFGCPKLVLDSPPADCLFIDRPSQLLTEPYKSLTSVRELRIGDCSQLEALTGEAEQWLLLNRASLRQLSLYSALSLRSLPDSLQSLFSLKILELEGAKDLQFLPRFPRSMEVLWISGCNQMLKERSRIYEGADWPKISRILIVDIS